MKDTTSFSVVGSFKHIEVCNKLPLFDANQKQVSEVDERKVLMCGDFAGAELEGLTDIATFLWTDERVAAFEEYKATLVNEATPA